MAKCIACNGTGRVLAHEEYASETSGERYKELFEAPCMSCQGSGVECECGYHEFLWLGFENTHLCLGCGRLNG